MISKQPYEEAYDLRVKKDRDYNRNGVSINDYYPCGHESYFHEIWKKNLRLKSLIKSDTSPENESIRDTLIDMINYCAIYIDRLDSHDLEQIGGHNDDK